MNNSDTQYIALPCESCHGDGFLYKDTDFKVGWHTRNTPKRTPVSWCRRCHSTGQEPAPRSDNPADHPGIPNEETDYLRSQQAAAVMPLIGPLLDSWEQTGAAKAILRLCSDISVLVATIMVLSPSRQ